MNNIFNYSFWADEAGISSISRLLANGQISLAESINSPGIVYQKLHMLIIAASFRLFGISELAARIPSVVFYLVGIYIIYLLGKKLSNVYGGLLSAFVFVLSELNLAYAIQAKPYQLLQLITLTLLLLIHKIQVEKRPRYVLLYHGGIIVLLSMATLAHHISIFLWLIYGGFLALKLLSESLFDLPKKLKKSKYLYVFTIFAVMALVVPVREMTSILVATFENGNLFKYNNIYQILKLFTYKYPFFTLSALIGFVWAYKNNREINISILSYSLPLLIFACFVTYIFNIRYVLPLFGIMFLYFGIFWAKAGEKYYPKKPWLIPLAVVVILYATGYKIVRYPQAYYNPNIDKYGDIQIANYKDFYGKLKERFPNYKKLYIVNNTFDAESWYMGRYSNAYFMKFTPRPYKHHTADAMIYGSLEDFRKIMRENPRGLLIMEDWQSFLPEDVKGYAKKNLKLEFRVNSLREAPDDPWPLALYSWGFP